MSELLCNADCNDTPDLSPSGAVGTDADRDTSGRFRPGNRASLIVGERSAAFWAAQADARREIAVEVLADAGFTENDAPRALRLAADGIAQASLIRDSAFARLVESGGPMTSTGRTRRAFSVWLAAADRLEKHLRLVGIEKKLKHALPATPAEARRQAIESATGQVPA